MTNSVASAERPLDVDGFPRTHVRALYVFIYGSVGNRQAAETITKDVCARARLERGSMQDEYDRISRLYQLARAALSYYWRDGQGVRTGALDEARLHWIPPPVPESVQQDRAAARATALLERVPETYRAILVHRLLERRSVAETARRMAISEAEVELLQHQALKRAAELQREGAWYG